MEEPQEKSYPKRYSRRTFLTTVVGGTIVTGVLTACGATTSGSGAAKSPSAAPAGGAAAPTVAAGAAAPTSPAPAASAPTVAGNATAPMVNIGGLYPVTGSFAAFGQDCVNAAKLAVQMVNDGGGIKSLGGAKMNLIISDVQSDTTVTRTETERLITTYKPAAIHGSYASALTLITSQVAERLKVPLITGSSSDQLNSQDFKYTFTPFARASQFAKTMLQMATLVADKPKVAVVFENTAFGTSTSKGLQDQAPGAGVEIVMFEPYAAGFTDASPLVNKIKASGASMVFPVSYLNDLILIIRTMKQMAVNIPVNAGSGGITMPDFYKSVGKDAEGVAGVAHWNHDINADAKTVNAAYEKLYGQFIMEYAGGLVAQTYMLANALERAASTDPQKVRDALATLDVSSGYAAMGPGGKVKFDNTGKNIYAHPVGIQWQKGDLVSVFPKEDAQATLMKP